MKFSFNCLTSLERLYHLNPTTSGFIFGIETKTCSAAPLLEEMPFLATTPFENPEPFLPSSLILPTGILTVGFYAASLDLLHPSEYFFNLAHSFPAMIVVLRRSSDSCWVYQLASQLYPALSSPDTFSSSSLPPPLPPSVASSSSWLPLPAPTPIPAPLVAVRLQFHRSFRRPPIRFLHAGRSLPLSSPAQMTPSPHPLPSHQLYDVFAVAPLVDPQQTGLLLSPPSSASPSSLASPESNSIVSLFQSHCPDAPQYQIVLYRASLPQCAEADLHALTEIVFTESNDHHACGNATLCHASELDVLLQCASPQNVPPLFRRLGIASQWEGRTQLLNVHWSMPDLRQTRTDGRVSLMRGHHAFYHYGCDGFQDQGWGCAYRAIQTLVSFLFLNHGHLAQGETARFAQGPVPSHREIQTALVALGDKPQSLVGSRQWIGSFEALLVLQRWYGVSSKIIYCPDGTHIFSHAAALQSHFDEVGTPVFIGGQDKAYTLLGIDLDASDSSTMRLLILDPHYVGPDVIAPILSKNGCYWILAQKFFQMNSFYNLCLPQV